MPPSTQTPAGEPKTPDSREPKGLQSLDGLRVVVAMMTGYLVLAGVGAYFAHPLMSAESLPEDTLDEGVVSGLLLAVGLMIPLEFVAFLAVRKSLRKQLDEDLALSPYRRGLALPKTFVTTCLIGAALTLGVGFFAVVIHLVSGSMAALAIIAAASFLLFYQLPSDETLLQG